MPSPLFMDHCLYAWTILFVYGLSSQCMNHPFSTYKPFHNWMKWHFECIKMHRWNLKFIKDYLWVYAAEPYAPYISEWKCTFESWSCCPLCEFIKNYLWVFCQGNMPLIWVSENALLKAEVVNPYASLSKIIFEFMPGKYAPFMSEWKCTFEGWSIWEISCGPQAHM